MSDDARQESPPELRIYTEDEMKILDDSVDKKFGLWELIFKDMQVAPGIMPHPLVCTYAHILKNQIHIYNSALLDGHMQHVRNSISQTSGTLEKIHINENSGNPFEALYDLLVFENTYTISSHLIHATSLRADES